MAEQHIKITREWTRKVKKPKKTKAKPVKGSSPRKTTTSRNSNNRTVTKKVASSVSGSVGGGRRRCPFCGKFM